MYESFYSFRKNPFSNHMDSDAIYLGEKHQAALTTLRAGLADPAGGITIVTGPSGTGKTTILQYALEGIKNNNALTDVTVGVVSDLPDSNGQLTAGLLASYGLDGSGKTENQCSNLLRNHLINTCYKQNRHACLVVEQAEKIGMQGIKELRELRRTSAYRDHCLQFILVGQDELIETLELPGSEAISRQIGEKFILPPLDLKETAAYIRHRINAVGGLGDSIFNDSACSKIHELSKGIPRAINSLCDVVLIKGYQKQQLKLDWAFVHQVVETAIQLKPQKDPRQETKLKDVSNKDKQSQASKEPGSSEESGASSVALSGEINTFEQSGTNPWDTSINSKVFELGRPIDKNSLSNRSSESLTVETVSSGSSQPFQVEQNSKGFRKFILGLLIVIAGVIVGTFVAFYLSGYQSF